MKNSILFFLLFSLVDSAYGQMTSVGYEADNKRYAFGIEPAVSITQFNDQSAVLIGGKLDWILKNQFRMGAKVSML